MKKNLNIANFEHNLLKKVNAMTIDRNAVKKIGRLARLALDEDKIPAVEQSLNHIFKWIEQLNEVDTSQVEPLFSVIKEQMPRREDVISDGDKADAVLQNAPDKSFNMFAVPKVVE